MAKKEINIATIAIEILYDNIKRVIETARGKAWPILNAVRSELSWTHYRLLLKVEKEEVRHFYIQEASEGNWSTRTLQRFHKTRY